MAPVSSLGAVVSWEEDDSDGEAKAVLGSYCVASGRCEPSRRELRGGRWVGLPIYGG